MSTGVWTATITWVRANKTTVLTGAEKIQLDGNVLKYTLESNVYAVAGALVASVELYKDGSRLTTCQFTAKVRGQLSDGTEIPAQDEYNILLDLLAKVETSADQASQAKEDAESAVESLNGMKGTLQGWLDDPTQFEGLSAYEVWLAQGNVGTEAEFIASLKGGVTQAEFESHLAETTQQINSLDVLKADQTDLEAEVANRTSAVSVEQAARLSEVGVERARIDSFTTLVEGSTTGDAELIDARIGADGITYSNVGGSIRGQIDSLNDDLMKKKIDTSLWEIGSYSVNTGNKQANGNYIRMSNYASDRIKNVTSDVIYFYLFAYENGEYIGVWRKSTSTFIQGTTSAMTSINLSSFRKLYPTYDFKISATYIIAKAMTVDDAQYIALDKFVVAYLEDAAEVQINLDSFKGGFTDEYADISLWESGLYNASTGTKTPSTSTTWLRTKTYLPGGIKKIYSESYSMILGAFYNGVFVGSLKKSDNTFVTTGTTYNTEFDIKSIKETYPNYDLVVSFKKSDGSVISLSDAENVTFTDETKVLPSTVKKTIVEVENYVDVETEKANVKPIPTGGQIAYVGDTKSEYKFIRNAIAYDDGIILACRSNGEVARIGYDGTEEILLKIGGTKMDWRCLWKDSNDNVYCSPHGSWGNVTREQRGLYRLEKGGSGFVKVIALYNESSSVETETQINDDTVWTMCEDKEGNIYADVYAHTLRANPSIYKSTNNGETFTKLIDMREYIPTGKHIHSLIYSKWQDALYCIVGEYNSIFKSVDGGVTWVDLNITLDAKGSAMIATKDGIFIGSDGTMLRIDWLHNDDVTHETVFRGWANTIFAIRQSDITGFLYAYTKIDSSVNISFLYPPATVLDGTTTIEEWKETVAEGSYNSWKRFHDEVVDIYPEDAIRPQHYAILISRDGGRNWEVLKYIKCLSTDANGFWTVGWFKNGEILAGVQEDYEIKRPIIISEGKHKYVSGGCDLGGEIFVRTNASSVVELI